MFKGKQIMLMPYQPEHGSYIANWYYSGKYQKFFRHITRPLSYPEVCNYPMTMDCTVMMVMFGNLPVGMITIHHYKPMSRCYKIGMMLDDSEQNKGFAPDACVTLGNYLFNTVNARKLIFVCLENDERTIEVLTKGGLRKEATLKSEAYYKGRYLDELHYTIFKEQFNALYKQRRKKWEAKSEQPSALSEDSQQSQPQLGQPRQQ